MIPSIRIVSHTHNSKNSTLQLFLTMDSLILFKFLAQTSTKKLDFTVPVYPRSNMNDFLSLFLVNSLHNLLFLNPKFEVTSILLDYFLSSSSEWGAMIPVRDNLEILKKRPLQFHFSKMNNLNKMHMIRQRFLLIIRF